MLHCLCVEGVRRWLAGSVSAYVVCVRWLGVGVACRDVEPTQSEDGEDESVDEGEGKPKKDKAKKEKKKDKVGASACVVSLSVWET